MKQILMFLLFAALLTWFMFAPMYKHVIIMRQAALQQEVDYLLEIGANGDHGYIDSVAVFASRERLAARGFEPEELAYEVRSTDGRTATNAAQPVLRGIGIELVVTYPYRGLFEIDRLIGITPPSGEGRMGAVGLKMSEYVP